MFEYEEGMVREANVVLRTTISFILIISTYES